jgi:phosphoglycolate phosphatase
MPQQPTVVLFDIDGTLLLTGGCGRRAFEHAFDQITGQRGALNGFSFGGLTDHAIARMGLAAIGRAHDALVVNQLLDTYLEALERELLAPPNFVVLPGVRGAIEPLLGRQDVAVGLGTGNVRRGAQAKLAHAGLWQLFSFGGFGCDHEDRAELLRAGAERGAEQLGRRISACRIVVVGDTVRDVAAAHAIGATCVAVCTGSDKAEALTRAGADRIFENLAQTGLTEALLSSRPPLP